MLYWKAEAVQLYTCVASAALVGQGLKVLLRGDVLASGMSWYFVHPQQPAHADITCHEDASAI